MRLSTTLGAILAHQVLALDGEAWNDGYLKMDAVKYRGNTWKDAQVGAEPRLLKRSTDDTAEFVLTNANTFYRVEMEVGSEKETMSVLVDTGSSDLWVVGSNNSLCSSSTSGSKRVADSWIRNLNEEDEEDDDDTANKEVKAASVTASTTTASNGKGLIGDLFGTTSSSASSSSATLDCSEYGTFDESDSTSFQSNGTSFYIKYADSTYAKGWWGTDSLLINGITVKDMSIAVCDETDNNLGVMGIGLKGLEATYGGSASTTQTSMYEYENLPYKLKSSGIIKSASYSIYLNGTDSSSASVLFGGVDHDKYTGELTTFPIINTLTSYGYTTAIKIEITLNKLIAGSYSNDEQVTIATGSAAALLDTGTTLTYVPSDVLSEIQTLISMEYSSSVGYYMKCSDGDNYFLTWEFQGRQFRIAFSSFLIELETNSGVSSYCYVGLQDSGDDSFTLGDSFLRNVYFVTDMDNGVVGLGVANLNSTTEDIEAIDDSIPSGVEAASYSETWGETATQLSTQAISSQTITSMGNSSGDSESSDSTGSTASKDSAASVRSSMIDIAIALSVVFVVTMI